MFHDATHLRKPSRTLLPKSFVSFPRSGPSQSGVIFPALKQSLGPNIAERQRRTRAVQRDRFKRTVRWQDQNYHSVSYCTFISGLGLFTVFTQLQISIWSLGKILNSERFSNEQIIFIKRYKTKMMVRRLQSVQFPTQRDKDRTGQSVSNLAQEW